MSSDITIADARIRTNIYMEGWLIDFFRQVDFILTKWARFISQLLIHRIGTLPMGAYPALSCKIGAKRAKRLA